MSHADLSDSTSSTPSIPTQFTADDGNTGIPTSNNYNILSRDTSANNDNGIQTTVDPNNSDNHYVELTNRIQGGASTIGAVTSDISVVDFSVAPFAGTAGTYSFQFKVASFETTTPAGGVYVLEGGVRTDGTTPTLIGSELVNEFEEVALNDSEIELAVSGNELVVRVTGVSGLTIAWDITGTYVRSI